MGGVVRHHNAQQPEQHLANLKEGSAACPQPSASHYGGALPGRNSNLYSVDTASMPNAARRNVSQQGLTQVQFPDFSRAQEELLIMWSENSKAVGFRTAAGASFA
ncbi:TPA: hypothetical protein ACH3X2_008966 [Trebouxia sp. C0005]